MVLMILAGVVLVGAITVWQMFERDMRRFQQALNDTSAVIETRVGPVERAVRGSDGPAVLVIHGAGGGFDQGVIFAETFLPEGYRWIAPSRFGYLRSPLPEDASTAAQADAFAALLDAEGIDRVAVMAVSGGVPPALQLAERHPDRVTALMLISSAPYTPYTTEAQGLPVPAWVYSALFSSDFPLWLVRLLAPQALEGLFDIRADLKPGMSPSDREFADAMVAAFLPVTQRLDGVRNEAAAIDPAARYDVSGIIAPALVIHTRDDGLNPFDIAERLDRDLPQSRLVALDTGGHLLLGRHDMIREEVELFLAEHSE